MDVMGFIAATIRLSTPLLLASVGQVYTQRSGVLNLGVEGIMAMGAIGGFIGAYALGSLWFGILIGMLFGGFVTLIFSILTVKIGANQILAGIALFLIGVGLADFVWRMSYGATFPYPILETFGAIHIPMLSQIPILGPILFQQNILVYLALISVILLTIILFRTTFGLKVKAVGINPQAVDSLGTNVNGIRHLCVIIGGLLAALGGAYLVLSELGVYTEGMIAGRGWVVIAVVIFSRWDPRFCLVGALLFGGAQAFQLRLQTLGIGIPRHFLFMLPYILSIIALISVYRKAIVPTSLARHFKRGER